MRGLSKLLVTATPLTLSRGVAKMVTIIGGNMQKKKKTTAIEVEKSKDMDFSVPVRIEERDRVNDLVYELSELDPRVLRQGYRTARAFQRANRMAHKLKEQYLSFSTE